MSKAELAFVFPGQGSQKVGMLGDLARNFPAVEETFAEASEVVGYDMWNLVQQGEQEQLNLTETTQPVLLTSSVALWRLWCDHSDARPAYMAGHSLGEFSALVCAGAIDFADGVDLVRRRGSFMQSAVPVGEGAMAAIIGLDDDAIGEACAQAAALSGSVVAAVNFNAPGQVVIAGATSSVEQASALCKEAGAKRALPLPVSAPFHTSLMKPAGDELQEVLTGIDISAPGTPVVHNVHAETETDPQRIRELLVEQIYSPVRWVSCVHHMQVAGVCTLVECGPGAVLSGLAKRIDRSLNGVTIDDSDKMTAALSDLNV